MKAKTLEELAHEDRIKAQEAHEKASREAEVRKAEAVADSELAIGDHLEEAARFYLHANKKDMFTAVPTAIMISIAISLRRLAGSAESAGVAIAGIETGMLKK